MAAASLHSAPSSSSLQLPVHSFTTAKGASHFYSSQLIIIFWHLWSVSRSCISVCHPPLGFPVCCCSHITDCASGRELLVPKACFHTWLCPKRWEALGALKRQAQITVWPWRAKRHFKFVNASCHHSWATPKAWSELCLGLGEMKFTLRCLKSLSRPTDPSGTAQHAVFAHWVPAGPGALTKGAVHSPAPWHPGPTQHRAAQALQHRGDVQGDPPSVPSAQPKCLGDSWSCAMQPPSVQKWCKMQTPVLMDSPARCLDAWQLQTTQNGEKMETGRPRRGHWVQPSSPRQDQFSPHYSWQAGIERNRETKLWGTGVGKV